MMIFHSYVSLPEGNKGPILQYLASNGISINGDDETYLPWDTHRVRHLRAIEGKGPELADPVSPHVHHKCSKISHVHSVDEGYITLYIYIYPEQAILVRSMKERHGKGKWCRSSHHLQVRRFVLRSLYKYWCSTWGITAMFPVLASSPVASVCISLNAVTASMAISGI